MALKDALEHPDYWGPETTDEDRLYAMRNADKTFAEKSLAEQQVFLKNLTKTRDTNQRRKQEEQSQRAQEGQQAQQANASWFQRNVAAPLAAVRDTATAAVKAPFDLAGKLDVASGIKTPEQAASRSEAYSKFLVPQTATELGIAAGTLAAGPAVRPLANMLKGNLSRAIPAAARVAGATAGGAAGGAVGSDDESAAGGALQGLLAGSVGEGVSYGVGKVLRSAPGAAKAIAKKDAARVGETVENISEPLRGKRTAEGLNQLAAGEGNELLSRDFGQRIHGIAREIQRTAPGGTINVPTMGGAVPFRAAVDELTKLNAAAKWPDPTNPTASGQAARRLASKLKTEIGDALRDHDLQTGAYNTTASLEGRWLAARDTFRQGRALTDFLNRAGAYVGEGSGMSLDVTKLQAALRDPKIAAKLERRLGTHDFKTLVAAVTRGAPVGSQDKMRSLAPTTLRGLLAMGLGGGAGAALHGSPAAITAAAIPALLPNVASRYVGKVPYTASEKVKTLADLVAGRIVTRTTARDQK